jgi:hypothetical protein
MGTPSHACIALLALFHAVPAHAMKPCPEWTYVAKPERPSAEWRRLATWLAVGVVVDRKERKVPYPNCGLEDRSACNQWDRSELTVKVERYEKGNGPAELHLVAAHCAGRPPHPGRRALPLLRTRFVRVRHVRAGTRCAGPPGDRPLTPGTLPSFRASGTARSTHAPLARRRGGPSVKGLSHGLEAGNAWAHAVGGHRGLAEGY